MKGAYFFAILAYVFLLWLTGFLVTRKSGSSEAYLIASRNLSVPLVSVLIAGTWTGGGVSILARDDLCLSCDVHGAIRYQQKESREPGSIKKFIWSI
jgi:hypothetical protein